MILELEGGEDVSPNSFSERSLSGHPAIRVPATFSEGCRPLVAADVLAILLSRNLP
jgi:hypothetical protein